MTSADLRSTGPVLFFALVGAAGCSNTSTVFPQVVKQRAAFDLSCDEGKISVQNLGGDTFGATGCAKKASYACICAYHVMGDCTKPVCTLDGAQTSPTPSATAQ
jgi:hypothetical protein